MNLRKIKGFASIAIALCATGCFDNSYDLSDIDTTVQVAVKDLVIPVNIDEIKLKSIIEETDEIVVIDGQYSYVTEGTFDSDPIKISTILVEVGDINPTDVKIKAIGGVPVPNTDIVYEISESGANNFDFEGNDINTCIHDISRVEADVFFRISLDVESFKSITSIIELNGIKLQLAHGLTMKSCNYPASYDATTGVLTLEDISFNPANDFNLAIEFTGVDIDASAFNYDTHTIIIHEKTGLLDGEFSIPASGHKPGATFPEYLDLSIHYNIDDFYVDNITGKINYIIENVNIPEVSLDDLPDFLNQPGTDLKFTNPQLYLQTNNPLQSCHLLAQTGLKIIAYRDDAKPQTYALDNPFKIGEIENSDNIYNFCVSPMKPSVSDPSFPNPDYVKFSSLGNVLSGDGLPKSIEVELIDPEIPLQTVTNFPIGKTYPSIDGKYKFIAPFSLQEGSKIIYSDKIDDWDTEDIEDLTITTLEISALVSMDVPVNVNFEGYPLDKNGNRIAGVSIEGANLKANCKDEPLNIRVVMPEGGIKGLGGIEFTATAISAGGAGLGPDMEISIKNLRPKVGGYYQKEL